MEIVGMISWEESSYKESSIDLMGGFFEKGMRWKDYLEIFEPESPIISRLECLRSYIVKNKIKEGGDWHQHSDEGVPLFDDGTVATFSYRAWGDLLAAIWAEEENEDYSYMDFYMSCYL